MHAQSNGRSDFSPPEMPWSPPSPVMTDAICVTPPLEFSRAQYELRPRVPKRLPSPDPPAPRRRKRRRVAFDLEACAPAAGVQNPANLKARAPAGGGFQEPAHQIRHGAIQGSMPPVRRGPGRPPTRSTVETKSRTLLQRIRR